MKSFIKEDECSLCDACIDVCTTHAIKVSSSGMYNIVDPEKCNFCNDKGSQDCVDACPSDCIITIDE